MTYNSYLLFDSAFEGQVDTRLSFFRLAKPASETASERTEPMVEVEFSGRFSAVIDRVSVHAESCRGRLSFLLDKVSRREDGAVVFSNYEGF